MAEYPLLRKKLLKPPVLDDVKAYLDGVLHRFVVPDSLIEWERSADEIRMKMLSLLCRGHRSDLLDTTPSVKWGKILETGAGYRIRKLLYEGYPGMWIPALLYEPSRIDGRVPVVLNPNGHHAGGKTMAYKQARCINLAKRGMLALSTEFIGMGELKSSGNHNMLAYLHLTGREGVGVFYSALKKALDVLLDHPNADTSRVAVTGLSGGGWQTLMLSALDKRVTVSVPVAGHSPVWQRVHCVADIGDLEQLMPDICTVADYDALTALIAPRPLLLIYNQNDDCCFRPSRTRKSIYEPVKQLYAKLYDPNLVELYINRDPGTHNYEIDSRQQLYRFLNKHFELDTPDAELDWEAEEYTERDLAVGVPSDNATIHSLAVAAIPVTSDCGAEEKEEKRERLRTLFRLPSYGVRSSDLIATSAGKPTVEQHILHMDGAWRLPVTVKKAIRRSPAVLLVGNITAKNLPGLSGVDYLQIHCDILGTGEMVIPNQYHMLLQAAGERTLGIMVAQLRAVIGWISTTYAPDRINLAVGEDHVGLAALVTAALYPGIVDAIEPVRLPISLADQIKTPLPVEGSEALLTFGLLKEFDIYDLIDLASGVDIRDDGRGIMMNRNENNDGRRDQ